MTASSFEPRPEANPREIEITLLERDIATLTRIQTDLKIDLVEANEKNRSLIINAIEINRKLLTDISNDICGDLRNMNRLINVKFAALAIANVIGFFTVIYLMVG
jgi:hypothetical protein